MSELKDALHDLAYYRWHMQDDQLSQTQYERSLSSYEMALYKIANEMPMFPDGFKGCSVPVNPHAGTGVAEKVLSEKYGLEVPRKQRQLQDYVTEELMSCLERMAGSCLLDADLPQIAALSLKSINPKLEYFPTIFQPFSSYFLFS